MRLFIWKLLWINNMKRKNKSITLIAIACAQAASLPVMVFVTKSHLIPVRPISWQKHGVLALTFDIYGVIGLCDRLFRLVDWTCLRQLSKALFWIAQKACCLWLLLQPKRQWSASQKVEAITSNSQHWMMQPSNKRYTLKLKYPLTWIVCKIKCTWLPSKFKVSVFLISFMISQTWT